MKIERRKVWRSKEKEKNKYLVQYRTKILIMRGERNSNKGKTKEYHSPCAATPPRLRSQKQRAKEDKRPEEGRKESQIRTRETKGRRDENEETLAQPRGIQENAHMITDRLPGLHQCQSQKHTKTLRGRRKG